MLKAILFDLDGTLLDRNLSLKNFIEHQYDRFNSFHHIKKEEFIERFIEFDQRGYVWKDRVYQALINEYDIKADWQDLLTDYIESFQNHCIGFPGLIEMLQFFKEKNIKLGLITNGYDKFQTSNINALNIHDFFEVILISEREGIRKPDPEIFIRALNNLGVKPEETIFVGDHPTNDVEASHNVGMKAVWKEDTFYSKPLHTTWTIRELNELQHIFDNMADSRSGSKH